MKNIDSLCLRSLSSPKSFQVAKDLVSKVYNSASVAEFELDAHNPSQKFIGVWEDDNIIGLGGYLVSPLTNRLIELNWAMVLEEYRGLGIGKKLLIERIKISEQEALEAGRPLEGWIVHSLPTTLYLSLDGIKLKETKEGKCIIFIPYLRTSSGE